MTCTCGRALRAGVKFCGGCGAAVPAPTDDVLAALAAHDPVLAQLAGGPRAVVAVAGDARRGKTTVAKMLAQEFAEVIDLGGLEEPETLTWVAVADVLIVVVSATQLLSETERALLLDVVLPLASEDVAIVVTRMDEVDTEEDATALDRRVRRFIERSGRAMPVFPVRAGVAAGLAAWVCDLAARAHRERDARWRRRVGAALASLEARLQDAPGPDVSLAADEARAVLHERISGLRATLPDRLAAIPAERLRAEAFTVLSAEVERLGEEVARGYLAALERAPWAGGAELRASREAPRLTRTRPASVASVALFGAGVVTLSIFGGPVAWVAAATLVVGSWRAREDAQARFDDGLRRDAGSAVAAWLDEAERDLEAGLARLVEEVRERMKPPGPDRAQIAALRERLA